MDEMVMLNQEWLRLVDAKRMLMEHMTEEQADALLAQATVCRTLEEMQQPGVGLLFGVVQAMPRRRRAHEGTQTHDSPG